MNIILIFFALKYKGDWNKIYEALDKKERVSLEDIKKTEDLIKNNKWKIITIIDNNYPKKLKEAFKPPFVIWYKGNEAVFKKKLICLTGEVADQKAIKRVKNFLPEITDEFSLVTSSYPGIDAEILKQTTNMERMFILSSGIDVPYLSEKPNETDLVISEFPPGLLANKERAKARNRLIASFARYLVLFNSTKTGPINNLVNNFLNLGKEIYCFPGEGDENDGNSELIKNGATLITAYDDIQN